ncbi:MAG: hypothetical protein L6R37_007250 [Teloschistes peruensis]|nr:MAG: hypothetical protein L6R37_007250 [Teloschistes peruensis]
MTIDSTQTGLAYRPELRIQIAQAFFGPTVPQQERIYALKQYFVYFSDEVKSLRTGISKESWQTKDLAIKDCEDLFHVVNVLRTNQEHRRPGIRQRLLSRFGTSNDLAINRSLNLALRSWLMINVQEPTFAGLRHGVTSVEWDDERTLPAFIESLFPPSRWPEISPQSTRLGPHFTAAFMQRVCGLSIEWTTSLHDHLRLDSLRKALKVFPYKCHLQALIDSHRNGSQQQRLPLPVKILQETILSLDLLFPFWDSRTITLLAKEKQDFHEYGPFEATRRLTLLDFDHWRDRLLELHEEIFQSPPVSWAQLWRDRRSPQQFWTFWIAIIILILTSFSTVATIIQAWASLKALDRLT